VYRIGIEITVVAFGNDFLKQLHADKY